MAKKVLVIGAGIAGLAAASYLRRNGFETEIFEANTMAGGLCTGWKRNGFTFDGCIHWLMGSSPTSNLHTIWKELGAGDLDYIEWSVYTVVRLSGGDSFTVYTDPATLEAEMIRLSPEDSLFAGNFTRAIRAVSRIDLPGAFDALSGGEKFALLARLPAALIALAPWMKKSFADLIGMIRGEKLREAFSGLYGESTGEFPATAPLMMLGFMAKKSSGYPIGGSLAFAQAIERKYLELGGKIHYGNRVDEILVEGGVAVGLRGAWGEARCDYVVAAGDAHDLMTRLLGGRYAHADLDEAFRSYRRFPSLIFVSIGLGADYSSLPHSFSFPLAEPLVLEGGALVRNRLGVRFLSFDPTSAPTGKTAAIVMIETDNDAYWTSLHDRGDDAYTEEKRRVSKEVIRALGREFPGLQPAVETVDVATPWTFIRYTGNWHGSFEGWLPTTANMSKRMARTIPGIANLRLTGQWVSPGGGLPPCGMDGRNLAKELCKVEGIKFRPEA
jgi:phytoene dehydrogenase-like protein